MSRRPDWDSYFLIQAHTIATRGSCDRKQVGAVIVDSDRRIVATGYNGSAKGMPHCDDIGHELKEIDGRMSCVRTLHAESNAIDYAGGRSKGCTIYCTVTPCYDCAKRIANVGIWRVVYAEHYQSRNTDLVAGLFADAGVHVDYIPIRPVITLVCTYESDDEGECVNEARYERGRFCGIHAGPGEKDT